MKKSILYALTACITLFSSCILDCKTGSGDIISANRKTESFEKIVVQGSCDVIINRGDSISVQLKDYKNLIDLIETKVENNELVISYKDGSCVTNSKLEVSITMPHLKGIVIEGSGTVKANGNFKESLVNAEIAGSGDIFLNITDTIGTLKSEINGSGSIEALNSVCDTVFAEVNGSGDINATVLNYLKTKIAGSGDVTYKGNPKTETKITGSGEVKQK